MINSNKITENFLPPQIAGLFPGDNTIEFVGNRQTKTSLWIQNGSIHYFKDLPSIYYNLVKSDYLSQPNAVAFISKIHKELKDQVNMYVYFMWGDLDSTPDIVNGVLAPSENFRDQRDCPSLLWNKKQMTIDNYILTPRDLVMIDLMADDYKDAVIADAINVSHSYYDQIKRNLFKYTNTQTKTGLVLKAKTQKVI
jgi:DNA-binding CsgD family transcriptional regulator